MLTLAGMLNPSFLLDTNMILGLSLGIGIPLIVIIVVLVLFLMRGGRYKRALNDLSGRYESSHGILFGKIAQYISRLESIYQRNFAYGELYIELNNKYKDLKDYRDAEVVSYLRQLSDSLNDHAYKDFKRLLPETRKKMNDFESAVSSFSKTLTLKFEDEKKVQSDFMASQAALRKIRETYYSFQGDVGLLASTFDAFFGKCDNLLSEAEALIDRASYEDAQDIITKELDPVLKALDSKMAEIPEMCLQISKVLPNKIISLRDAYQTLMKDGYPLHHIMVDETCDQLEEAVEAMSSDLRSLVLGSLKGRIDALSDRIQSYFDAFEKEKASRAAFERDYSSVYREAGRLDNDYLQLTHAIPQAKKLYLFSPEDDATIENIKASINKAGAVKRRLDNLLHSGTKQPFSVLLTRMEDLRKESEGVKEEMGNFTMRLRSFKEDVEKAAAAVGTSLTTVREAEADLQSAHLESLDKRFLPATVEIRSTIDELSSLLHAMPIDVSKVNDAYSRLSKAVDALSGDLGKALEEMKKAEAAIVYANRYRSGNEAVADALRQAETLFYDGDFERSYVVANSAIPSSTPDAR